MPPPDDEPDRPPEGRRRFDDDDDRPRRRRRDDDDDEYDRPRRRPADDGMEAIGAIIPVNVSVWSLISCYTGLIGMCLPPFALVAVVCGIIALRKRSKKGTYGAVTSDIRAIIGLVFGGIGLAWGVLVLVLIATGAMK